MMPAFLVDVGLQVCCHVVKSILCFGDSNTWGCIPQTGPEPPRRYPSSQRWPGVLRRELGDGYWIVEEGLNGRTTVWDDPLEPSRNGKDLLLPSLMTHQPVDLVVVMLGTNDLKHRFGVGARDIAAGAGMLLDLVRASACGPEQSPPRALLVCPAPLGRLDLFAEEFAGAVERSRDLARQYTAVADARSCPFVDAGAHVRSSDTDGIHLDAPAHERLGVVVAQQVRQLLV
jgi:lysophospholipase L1-like esterase